MSYRDPYVGYEPAGRGGAQYQNNEQHYGQSQLYTDSYPRQPPYENVAGHGVEGEYNPYTSNQNMHMDPGPQENPYDKDYGYDTNAYQYPPVQRQQTVKSVKSIKQSVAVVPVRDSDDFTPITSGRKRTVKGLRDYRFEHQGNIWTQGTRGRCVGRFCCCTLMTTVFLIVSIVLSLALWVRPPSIQIGQVKIMTGANGQSIQQLSDGVAIDLGVDISVKNPNYFSVDFRRIQAEIFYPIDDTPVGGGVSNNIVFKSTSQTNFTFPFSLSYNATEDPQSKVILDLANKCGISGGPKTNINVNYKITLGIHIIMVTVSPVISNQFNFPCPLQASDISKFLGGSLPGLT